MKALLNRLRCLLSHDYQPYTLSGRFGHYQVIACSRCGRWCDPRGGVRRSVAQENKNG